MGKLFDWLDKDDRETTKAYDNKINRMQGFHAGYVFFDWVNYDEVTQIFSVYVEWNGELNYKLQDAMPQGGYCFRCSKEEAVSFINDYNGAPLYIKLCSKAGRLYVKKLYFTKEGRCYQIFFNGCDVVTPEMICFMGRSPFEKPDISVMELPEPQELHRSSVSLWRGSKRTGMGYYGSYAGGSYRNVKSSYRSLFGSYLGWTGSYRRGSYRSLLGSYLGWTGSYSRSSYRSLLGSYRGVTGSYRQNNNNNNNRSGSYRGAGGSFRSINGSFRGITGSGHRRSGSYYGISDAHKDFLYMEENEITIYEEGNEVPDIGALGYGLDLI